MQYIIMQYIITQYIIMQYIITHYIITQYIIMQYIITHYIIIQSMEIKTLLSDFSLLVHLHLINSSQAYYVLLCYLPSMIFIIMFYLAIDGWLCYLSVFYVLSK